MTYMVSEPLPYTASSDNANLGTVDGDLFLKIDGVEMSIDLMVEMQSLTLQRFDCG